MTQLLRLLATSFAIFTMAAPAAAADKTAQLDALYAQYWEEYLELNPLAATFQGDTRYNDRLPNTLSEEYRRKTHDFNARWLKQIESIGAEGLDGQALEVPLDVLAEVDG